MSCEQTSFSVFSVCKRLELWRHWRSSWPMVKLQSSSRQVKVNQFVWRWRACWACQWTCLWCKPYKPRLLQEWYLSSLSPFSDQNSGYVAFHWSVKNPLSKALSQLLILVVSQSVGTMVCRFSWSKFCAASKALEAIAAVVTLDVSDGQACKHPIHFNFRIVGCGIVFA